MYQFLFIAALFLTVILALNFEILLLPNLVILGFGAGSVILGAGIFLFGNLRKASFLHPEQGKPRRSAACLSGTVGGMYILLGIGIWILQGIGYFH